MTPLENCKIFYNNGKIKNLKLSINDKKYKPGLYLQNFHFIKNLNRKANYNSHLSDINDAYKTFKLCSLIENQ